MKSTTLVLGICAFLGIVPRYLIGQTESAAAGDHAVVRVLVPTQKITTKSEAAGLISNRVRCDSEGNVYYPTDMTEILRKLNLKGERIAEFRPNANPNLPVDLFTAYTISRDGEVFMLVNSHDRPDHIFVYKSDGSYHSSIELDTGFRWGAINLAMFPSGGFLISGLKYARNDQGKLIQVPVTGIFSADGRLLKELNLEDDDDIVNFAATGDPRIMTPTGNNRAIEWTQMETGEDGNIYLMRWTNPVIVYAISPGGSVVRRFLVDPKNSGSNPDSIHLAGTRIAVLFINRGDTKAERVIKVLDLEGHPLATYNEVVNDKTDETRVSGVFACYTNNPEHFTFLTFGENNRLVIETVEPR